MIIMFSVHQGVVYQHHVEKEKTLHGPIMLLLHNHVT